MNQSGEGRVLVVDDEPLILVLLEEFVSRCGYEPVKAHNGFEGIRVATRTDDLQLVITDLQMPELGGIELIQELRKKSRRLPAILISGCCSDFNLVRKQLNDFTFFVEKPFGFQKLRDAIEGVMAQAKNQENQPAVRGEPRWPGSLKRARQPVRSGRV